MQIELLETFLDLLDSRSFNRTADRMGVTQSTVSARVAALEAAVGARLFTRSRAGTDVTPEGRKFEGHARALRHAWGEAQRSVQAGAAMPVLRIGIQNDLAARQIGTLAAEFRKSLPDCAFYIEPDYSTQMCADLATGTLDFAVLFTPAAIADLHVASIGHVRYHLVSSDTDTCARLDVARYVRANYAPAFEAEHRRLFPALSHAPLAAGQDSAIASLLRALGGSAYVQEETAAELVGAGGFRTVADAPVIAQPVYAVTHLRHRTGPQHQRLHRIVARAFAGR